MGLRTIFGRKIKGETLKNLIEALGGNYDSYLNREYGWDVPNLTGRMFIRPIDKGFDVKIAIKLGDIHVRYDLGMLRGIIPYSLKQRKLWAKANK